MDQLPAELVHRVCSYLNCHDVQNFRLINKAFANVGAEYFLSDAFFFVHQNSYDHLLEIARHPHIRRSVTDLHYQAHFFVEKFANLREFEASIDERFRDIKSPPPGLEEDEEVTEYYYNIAFQEAAKKPRHSYTRAQLRKAYRLYNEIYDQQQDIWNSNKDIEWVAEAVKSFPKLRNFTLQSGWSCHTAKRITCGDTFKDMLKGPHCDYEGAFGPQGVRQLTSLLAAAADMGRQLKRLTAKTVSWQVYRQEQEVLEKIATACSSLTCLELEISTGTSDGGHELAAEAEESYNYLKESKACLHIIEKLLNLEKLEFKFELCHTDPDQYPARLQDIIPMDSDHTYPRLCNLVLGCVEVKEDLLIKFFERHSSTLTRIDFDTIKLTSGRWTSFLPKVHKALPKLERGLIYGELKSVDGSENYDVPDFELADQDDMREALSWHLSHGGDCPLDPDFDRDEWHEYNDDDVVFDFDDESELEMWGSELEEFLEEREERERLAWLGALT